MGEQSVKDISYWKQFESTGRIEDYLNYRLLGGTTGERSNEDISLGGQEINPYAGIRMCNGNNFETDACGGIRQEDNAAH